MYSNFEISSAECLSCTNQVLKTLGTLRGVFGAEVDRVNGQIIVSHTDEVSRKQIAETLEKLGINEIKTETTPDEPSEWGCAL